MKELSLHILDLAQNSIHAKASRIDISIVEDTALNTYTIEITDNGKGMSAVQLRNVLDPFFTTKKKKTGLGIPLMKQHVDMANGSFTIESLENHGTTLRAQFQHDHLDRQPLGDITQTLLSILVSCPSIDISYSHSCDARSFVFDTVEFKTQLDEIPINNPDILRFIKEFLESNLSDIGAI